MQFCQILVYEGDGRIADLLRRQMKSRTVLLREPRRLDTCLKLLREAGPSVLLIRLGRDLLRELSLLDQVSWLYPETATVAIGDPASPALLDLVWDLGASLVLPDCPPSQQLNEIVMQFLADPGKILNARAGSPDPLENPAGPNSNS
jgi:hypothetical protein